MPRTRSSENPYESAGTVASRRRKRPRWIRDLVVLNSVLLLLPVLLALSAYGLLRAQLAREAGKLKGDPVTYQHEFVGFSGPPLAAICVYFLVPNLVLVGWTGTRLWLRRKRAAASK